DLRGSDSVRMMTMRRRYLAIAAFASVAAWGALLAVPRDIAAKPVPVRLSDQEFWKTVVTFSEPGGTFRSSGAIRSDNLISNETSFHQVIPALQSAVGRGAYLGVGPEQNFTYIAALKPKIAFIIDIRRQNMIEHLMYKALFELSKDRVDFLSRLLSRPRPADVGKDTNIEVLIEAFRQAPAESGL